MPNSRAYVVHGARVYDLDREAGSYQSPRFFTAEQFEKFAMLAVAASAQRGSSLFRLVSRISPCGAGNLEDVAIYDTDDPTRALLLIVNTHPDDVVVYRRVYSLNGE